MKKNTNTQFKQDWDRINVYLATNQTAYMKAGIIAHEMGYVLGMSHRWYWWRERTISRIVRQHNKMNGTPNRLTIHLYHSQYALNHGRAYYTVIFEYNENEVTPVPMAWWHGVQMEDIFYDSKAEKKSNYIFIFL